VAFWRAHRALLRATGGRFGLSRPKAGRCGTLRLTTTGRRSGVPRQVVVGYVEDGRALVTMAMNGWGPAEPAWWLNLQDHPDAIVQTRDGSQQVRARRAREEERERLWSRWAELDKNLDDYAARRPTETAVVVLEPRVAAEPRRSTASAESHQERSGRGAGSRFGPSAGTGWRVPALAGAGAFWLANLAISLTPVAAGYRSALSIPYLPMLGAAAVGGLVVAAVVAFLLTRFPDRVPGHDALGKALALAVGALVLLTLFLALPSLSRANLADPGHWLLVGAAIDTIRILALGVAIGLVTRARTTRQERHRLVARREAQS